MLNEKHLYLKSNNLVSVVLDTVQQQQTQQPTTSYKGNKHRMR